MIPPILSPKKNGQENTSLDNQTSKSDLILPDTKTGLKKKVFIYRKRKAKPLTVAAE